MMLERCGQFQIYLNLKKCIFRAPFGIFLGHVVCNDGILMDPAKIEIIVDLPPPMSIKKLMNTLGHTGYAENLSRGMPRSLLLWKSC